MAAREEYKLIEDRTISGRGLFKIPPSDAYRNFILYINVVRLPRVNYSSSKFNPDKSEYAKITWLRKDYVMSDNALNYENQVYEFNIDPCGYLATSLTCMYATLRDTLVYMIPFLPAPPQVVDPTDKIYTEPLRNAPDTIKIVCRGDTAIVAKLYALNYDVNCPEATPSPKPPPDPPPVPQVPPGTGVGTTPPYDGQNDNGDTVPYTTDVPDVPEQPGDSACTKYLVKCQYDIQYNGNTVAVQKRDVVCWGKIGAYTVTNDGFAVSFLQCQGVVSVTDGATGSSLGSPNEQCQPTQSAHEISRSSVGINFHFAANPTILSIEPV